MECFRLLFDHQFLSGIRDSRRAESLWGMMWGVGGVRKSEHQGWLAKGLGLLCWGFKVLTKMGIKTVPNPPYSPDLAPCDFYLFPKLTGCRSETIEEMKEAVTKVIDMLTQEDFHEAFQKLLKRYNKCIAAGGDYFEIEFHACTINKSAHTKKVWKLI